MGYTTDANYLIQAGKDIAESTADAGVIVGQFDAGTYLAWHEWGPAYQALGNAYTNTRSALLDCMEETVELLTAYAEALQETGAEYLSTEELTWRLIEGIR